MHFSRTGAIESMRQNFRSKNLIYDKSRHQRSGKKEKAKETNVEVGEEKREITRRYVDLAPARSKCSSWPCLTAKAFNNRDTFALLIANSVQATTH